jgi:hypothetical protein
VVHTTGVVAMGENSRSFTADYLGEGTSFGDAGTMSYFSPRAATPNRVRSQDKIRSPLLFLFRGELGRRRANTNVATQLALPPHLIR